MGRRDRRRTWMYGGSGLILCGVLGLLQHNLAGATGADVVRLLSDAIFAVSLLLFAFGLSRKASVVDRKPLGVTAMAVLAVWPLVTFALERTGVLGSSADDVGWSLYGYSSLLVPAAAALVASAQIARRDNVPLPWRWAPMWVLGFNALIWAIPQIIFVTVRPEEIQALAGLLLMLAALASLATTLGLGILAIVLAVQQRPGTVEVYRSPS